MKTRHELVGLVVSQWCTGAQPSHTFRNASRKASREPSWKAYRKVCRSASRNYCQKAFRNRGGFGSRQTSRKARVHRETFARFHLSLGMSGWKDLVYLSERLRRATSKVMISLREARDLRNHRNNSSDLTPCKCSVICYVLGTHYRAMSRTRGCRVQAP